VVLGRRRNYLQRQINYATPPRFTKTPADVMYPFHVPARLVCYHHQSFRIRARALVSALACRGSRPPCICLASSSNSPSCSLSWRHSDRRDRACVRRFREHADNTVQLLHIFPKNEALFSKRNSKKRKPTHLILT